MDGDLPGESKIKRVSFNECLESHHPSNTGGSDPARQPKPALRREAPKAKTSLYGQFKAACKALKREVLVLYYAVHDSRTPFLAKILPWIALVYALSPLDLIPDFIPILGLVDDLLLLPGLIWLALMLIPKQIMEDARQRAEREPLYLSANWPMAVFVFLLWTAGIEYSLYLVIPGYAPPEVLPYMWHILAGTAVLSTLLFIWWLTVAVRHEAKKKAKMESAARARQQGGERDLEAGAADEEWSGGDDGHGGDKGREVGGGLQEPLLATSTASQEGV